MMRPRLRTGAKTPERVPTTTPAAPERMRRHCSLRSVSLKAECRMATRSPKREKNWPATAGVRAISGTSSSALRPGGERRIDGVEVDLGLAGAGDAVEQESGVAAGGDGVANALERGLLGGVEHVAGAHGAGRDGDGLRRQTDETAAARERTRRGAGVGHEAFEFLEVVRAGVQFEEGQQLALGLGELDFGRAAGELHAQAGGGDAQRVAVRVHVLGGDEAAAFERAHGLIGERQLLGEVRGGEGALLEQAQDLDGGVVRGGVEHELAGGVAAGVGERVELAAADFGGQREHAAQHLAERGAVVGGDPAGERDQLVVEHGLGIDQAEGVADGHVGRLVVAGERHAGELARAEGHDEAAAGLDAVAQGLGQRVGEGAVERHRQADVAVEWGAFGHGSARVRCFAAMAQPEGCAPGSGVPQVLRKEFII